jgi:hypothetical protein
MGFTIVFEFQGGNSLCLSENNEWLLRNKDKTCFLSKPDCILGLLPLLELEYEDFLIRMEGLQISKDIISKFPLAELMKYPFENQREYWSLDSINWIEKSNKKQDLQEWAISIPTNWMSQVLRHKFKTMFRIPKNE